MPENHPGYDSKRYRLTPDVRLRLAAEGLKPRTLLLLDALVDHDWSDASGRRKGLVWPSVSTLARLIGGVTERTVQLHLGYLIRGGYIARSGNRGRGRPSVVALQWRRIVGEVEIGEIAAITAAEYPKRTARAQKPFNAENQQKAGPPAGSASAPPPRRVREAVPEGVPCPPAVAAQLAALFEGIGGRRVARTAAPARVFDRQEREAWADDQLARARALGLG